MYNSFEKPYRPKELTEQRKAASDNKNKTDSLTFEDSSNNNERAAAYKANRDNSDETELLKLVNQTDESELLAELDLMERDYING